MYKRLMLGMLAAAVVAAAACSSGGGNVTPNNPLNPTTAPSGVVVSPSPISSGSTTAPTATPTGTSSTSAPTATPTGTTTTPSPSPTPTSPGTTAPATPTASPTASSSSLSCTHNTSSPTEMTYSVGNGTSGSPQAAETITLPSYPSTSNPVIAGTSNLPTTYTNDGKGTTLTIKISQANFDNVAASTYGNRTPDFFTSLEVDPEALGLGNGSDTLLIPVTITSPCVTTGTTYTVNEFDSTLGVALYSETDTASGTTVTGHIQASVNPFTAGQVVDIIVSH